MSFFRLLPALGLLVALAWLALLPGPSTVSANQGLVVATDITYDVRPDAGPVSVAWEVALDNQDPQTVERDEGRIFFYQSLTVPLLQGAANVSARSDGTDLSVSLEPPGESPVVRATVTFDRRLFFGDTYSFVLDYDLPTARADSLLVTQHYVFLPAVAFGNRSDISVLTPTDATWEVNLDPGDCGSGPPYTCQAASGEQVQLAAVVEIVRPDAAVTVSVPSPLLDVEIELTYFEGEEAWAEQRRLLIDAALPVIEELYGFPYPGPPRVSIAQSGRQLSLGYEGLISCTPQACDIAVSPIANDTTFLHELAHLWSNIYDKRWLAEGFAEFIAHQAAQQLGPLIERPGDPPAAATVDFQLDEWGEVDSLIGATVEQQAIEQAGYDLSFRFIGVLADTVGLEALQRANARLAEDGVPADSQRYLDVLEEASGQRLDQLFLLWVFPQSFAPVLEQRREARDRLAALSEAVAAEGLDPAPPDAIQELIAAWRFEEALVALEEAEAGLSAYVALKPRLDSLRENAQAAGLTFPRAIEQAIADWQFISLERLLDDGEAALAAYVRARDKVDEPRNLWQRIGLLGRNPEGKLDEATTAFAAGTFDEAIAAADRAFDMVDGANSAALVRVLVVLAVLGSAMVAAATIWYWRRYLA